MPHGADTTGISRTASGPPEKSLLRNRPTRSDELGIELDKVQRQLRHRSITTTQQCIHSHLRPGQSPSHRFAAEGAAAEIELPGSGTLGGAVPSGAVAATRAVLTAHSPVAALHRIAEAGDSLPATVVAEIAATFTAPLDRCDGANPTCAPLAETARALIAGGLPSLAGSRPPPAPSDDDAAR